MKLKKPEYLERMDRYRLRIHRCKNSIKPTRLQTSVKEPTKLDTFHRKVLDHLELPSPQEQQPLQNIQFN